MPDVLQSHPLPSQVLVRLSEGSRPCGRSVRVRLCSPGLLCLGSARQTGQEAALRVFLAGGCGKCWKGKMELKQSAALSASGSEACARPGSSAPHAPPSLRIPCSAPNACVLQISFYCEENSSSLIAFQGIRWDRQTAYWEKPWGLCVPNLWCDTEQ